MTLKCVECDNLQPKGFPFGCFTINESSSRFKGHISSIFVELFTS